MRLIEVVTYDAAREAELAPSERSFMNLAMQSGASWQCSEGQEWIDSLGEHWLAVTSAAPVMVRVHTESEVRAEIFFRVEAVPKGNFGGSGSLDRRVFMRPIKHVELLESALAQFHHRPLGGFLVIICLRGCEHMAIADLRHPPRNGIAVHRFLQPLNS